MLHSLAQAVSAPDPFTFDEYPPQGFPNGAGYDRTAGLTQASSIIAAPSTTKTIIIGGQSLMATACGTTEYTTVSADANQLSIYDGAIYEGSDPVQGASYAPGAGPSSVCMRIADDIIDRGKATRCIVVPIAMGGTPFAIWEPSAAGTLFGRLRTAILRCRARGLEPDAIIWGQGETDAGLGTSAASITASIQAIVAGIRALSCTAPFYAGYYTYVGGVTNAAVRTGITNALSAPDGIIAGFDCDTLTGADRLVDDVHLSDAGLDAAAAGWSSLLYP